MISVALPWKEGRNEGGMLFVFSRFISLAVHYLLELHRLMQHNS